ncbi:hypothetical protein [Nevskia soli]|uniref:hypothetical protein n=1 Tax=Nevskia soli TaxID=418856 RepID=UPI0004A731CA|nr:hypothetical protein [Nevskia soli]
MDWSEASAQPVARPAAIEQRLAGAFSDRCGQDTGWFVGTGSCDKGVSVFVVGRSGNVVGKRRLESSDANAGRRSGLGRGRTRQPGLAKFEPYRNLANGLLLMLASVGVLFLAIGELQKLLSLTDASIGAESRQWLERTGKEVPERFRHYGAQMLALCRHWSERFETRAKAAAHAALRARANYLPWTIRSSRANVTLSSVNCEAIANSPR